MTDNEEKKGGSIFDDIEDLFSSGAEIAKGLKGAITSHREEGTLTDEPLSSHFSAHLRALLECVEEEEREGMLHMQIVKKRIRIIIGDGGDMRVYEGANVVEAIDLACANELELRK